MEYTLKEICFMQSGGTPKSSNISFYGGKIPWVTISDFKKSESNIIYKTEQTLTEEGLAAINGRFFKKNTLLLAMYGSVGKTAILGVDASTNQAILGISPKDEKILNIKFLKYWLDQNKDFLYSQGKGATLHNISLTIVQRQKINIPDLETQNKIVAILDKANGLIEKREQTIKMFDELLRATFLDMFGQPNKNKSNNDFLENISIKITDGTHQSPTFLDEGVPFLLVSNIVNNEIVYKTKKYISEDEYIVLNKRTPIEIGDILITSVGSYGNPAMVKTITKFAFQRHIAYIKPDKSKINSVYLLNALKSDYVNFQIEKVVKGAAQKTLNLSDLRKITIPVPDIQLQNKFEIIYLKFEKYKASLIKSKSHLENLINGLSQSAFNGELNFNTAVALELLLEKDYEFFKEKSNDKSIQLLLDRLNKDELNEKKFFEREIYDKAKGFVFELLKEGKVKQTFDEKTKQVKLTAE